MEGTPAETPEQQPPPARAAQPTTPEELRRSLKVIRVAITFSVVTIALMTWIFVDFLGAPAVPLVPLAIAVLAIDLVILAIFTRQRRQAIEAMQRRAGEDGTSPIKEEGARL